MIRQYRSEPDLFPPIVVANAPLSHFGFGELAEFDPTFALFWICATASMYRAKIRSCVLSALLC